MSQYFSTNQIEIISFNPEEITKAYDNGYVFTRLGKGIMQQTRSLRINVSKFKLNSENRRIIRKTEGLKFTYKKLPLHDYSWEIHKMGKDFYERFRTKDEREKTNSIQSSESKVKNPIMSASKIREMFNDMGKSNMNGVFIYEDTRFKTKDTKPIGYCLLYQNQSILHYAYPFYELTDNSLPVMANLGMGMMVRAVNWVFEQNKSHVYLGSVFTKASKYKLQFEGLEWFDTENQKWRNNIADLKTLIG